MAGPDLTVRADGSALLLNSTEAGDWELFNVLGRLMGRGRVAAGAGERMETGEGDAMFLLRFTNGGDRHVYRLLRSSGAVMMQPMP
jgi:hypothetical protein